MSLFPTALFRWSGWLGFCLIWKAWSATTPAPDFNRDIRPILSDHCYTCHGPDEGKRKAGLRLDRQEDVFKELKSGQRAVVPGDLKRSSLIQRIHTSDADELMPPAKHGKPLSRLQIELLDRWVSSGAPWKQHWSYIPPVTPVLPPVKDSRWPRNDVDRFILARMEQEGLKPNPEADRVTLMRRATLDLTGLPPTVEEVDTYLSDKSSDAYEKLVERLLASPQYGERMAANWLDLARFADTSGYHFDGVRFLWLWRDWVIDAFNHNQPYDAFTIDQLAGDLLPNPTTAQRIATGFVRNNMTNDEGGADPDEYLNKYIVDRVNTVGTVWMGLTVGCTECHDHKYDPMTTKEFYRMYAFFHNVPEKGLDRIRSDNPPPRLAVPTPDQAARFVEAEFNLRDAEKTLQDRINELGETQEKWERVVLARPPKPVEVPIWLTAALDDTLQVRSATGTVEGKWTGSPKPEFVDGRLGRALKLDGKSVVEAPGLPLDSTTGFTVSAWVQFQGNGAIFSQQEKAPGFRGADFLVQDGRLNVHLAHQWPDDAIKVRTKETFAKDQWHHLAFTYDGSRKSSGLKLYVNGKLRDTEVEKDQLKGSIANSEPFRIGSRAADTFLTGWVDDLRVESVVLSEEALRARSIEGYLPLISKSRGKRSDPERNDLARFYKENHAVDYRRAEVALARARSVKETLYGQIPTTLIMEEMDPPRPTHVLVRGDFRNPGEQVTAGTPAFLPPLASGPVNRLALARWLVSQENPLTARVTVNRYWALFFGTGLVKTINDFGSQGEWPSHPELLDWLATRFRDGSPQGTSARARHAGPAQPWDVKALVRLIVTSATYRQSAVVSPQKLEKDPYNRLLARGPRLRLEAEFIRDNALAVAGLLNRQVGGPSVKPYQPAGIWDGTDSVFVQDHGEKLYRRGMYVFWRRSAHYPPFATFDAPNREVCTFLRPRTQTPLQSLVLMNDPGFVEAARGLAQRVTQEEPQNLDRRLVRAFRHTLGRMPQPDEIAVLKKTYDQQIQTFSTDPQAAAAFLKVGESKAPNPTPELAAMTAVANVLLNLNETISK